MWMLDHDGGQGEVTPVHTEEDAKMDRWSREKADRGRQGRGRRGRWGTQRGVGAPSFIWGERGGSKGVEDSQGVMHRMGPESDTYS